MESKQEGVIHLGPIFHARALGFRSALRLNPVQEQLILSNVMQWLIKSQDRDTVVHL